MKKPQHKLPPRLVTSVFGYLLVGAVVLTAGLGVIMPRYSQAIADRVLGSHTTFDWVEPFLTESAIVRGIDVYLINVSGNLTFATDEAPVDLASVQSLRAAATGIVAQTREIWPDGNAYFATTIPAINYADLPSFGWRLVGRVTGDDSAADRRQFAGLLTATAVGAGVVFAACIALFALIFLRPLSRLVESAEKIAGGAQVYPPESRSSAEAIRLSWALARIESRRIGSQQPQGMVDIAGLGMGIVRPVNIMDAALRTITPPPVIKHINIGIAVTQALCTGHRAFKDILFFVVGGNQDRHLGRWRVPPLADVAVDFGAAVTGAHQHEEGTGGPDDRQQFQVSASAFWAACVASSVCSSTSRCSALGASL